MATEERLFKSYADAMITDAQQRGCSNVVPILKAAATTTYAPRRFVMITLIVWLSLSLSSMYVTHAPISMPAAIHRPLQCARQETRLRVAVTSLCLVSSL